MTIIDTHAHIDQLEDIPGALKRAEEAGVTDIMAMSVDLASMQKVLELAQMFQKPRIHPALGVHPGLVKPELQEQAFDFIRKNIGYARAIGETGLDYWYKWVRKDEVERNKQKESFAFHLQMAKEYNLPIVIHARGAWKECLAMTKDTGVTRALFHWYSGPIDVLEQILEAGFYVSTSPSVGYSPESRAAMAVAPLNKILIETDSPVRFKEGEGNYLAEPKDVIKTWQALADLKQMDPGIVLLAVNQNARAFFGISS